MSKPYFISILNASEKAGFREAVLSGIAGNNGLFMPDHIPVLPSDFFQRLGALSLQESSFEVAHAMLGSYIPKNTLVRIIEESLTYEIPLRQIDNDLYVLELIHGPTLAFKDTGARFMAALFDYLVKESDKKITILVATSGDTGSAVANAFSGYENINVFVLYPSGRVSALQKRMLTSVAGNITPIEVAGDFDDCQKLVKGCFSDKSLNAELNLTSANSINFARLFPQSFYYFHAISQLGRKGKPVAISVPSGNFGNLTAGIIATRMGLKIDRFIASCNENHPVVDYIGNGIFKPFPSKHTMTNAMDVGNPSNFPRLMHLFGNDHARFSSAIKGWWFDDSSTEEGMKELYSAYRYLSDPHGAVAYLGIKEYLRTNDATGIFLETAHPVKFSDEVERATGCRIEIPPSVASILDSTREPVRISVDPDELKGVLSHGSF